VETPLLCGICVVRAYMCVLCVRDMYCTYSGADMHPSIHAHTYTHANAPPAGFFREEKILGMTVDLIF